jgi:hypothetical protein
MNQREFSKNGAAKDKAAYAAQKVAPFYSSYFEKLRSHAEKNPKRTIIAMLLFATANFFLMVYLVNSRPSTPLIPKNISSITSNNKGNNYQAAAFSISNYRKISKLKDSLDYLIKLPQLTKNDSLLFIRICDEYSKLDPAFFKSVKQSIDKKNEKIKKLRDDKAQK